MRKRREVAGRRERGNKGWRRPKAGGSEGRHLLSVQSSLLSALGNVGDQVMSNTALLRGK